MDVTKLKQFLSINKKEKLCWTGDFDSLKRFLNDILNVKGQWSSPGGEAKALYDEEVLIRWYGSKQS